MTRVLALALLSVAALSWSCAADDEGFTPMFNGKDLSDWESKPGGWWVEDGAITSESTKDKPCVKHHYLVWKGGEPADFVIRFKYRIIGEGGNSGLQFRSERRPDYDTWGYQADIENGPLWTGCLFQHDRMGVVMRGFKSVIAEDGQKKEEQFASPEELQKVVKQNEWNDYEVSAIGSKIELRINGQLMCEVDDRDAKWACHKGIIAVQMHPGPPMKIQFKDMRIKVLKKE